MFILLWLTSSYISVPTSYTRSLWSSVDASLITIWMWPPHKLFLRNIFSIFFFQMTQKVFFRNKTNIEHSIYVNFKICYFYHITFARDNNSLKLFDDLWFFLSYHFLAAQLVYSYFTFHDSEFLFYLFYLFLHIWVSILPYSLSKMHLLLL